MVAWSVVKRKLGGMIQWASISLREGDGGKLLGVDEARARMGV